MRVDGPVGDAGRDGDPLVAIRNRRSAQDACFRDAPLPPPRRAPFLVGATPARGDSTVAPQGESEERATTRLG